MKKTWRAIPHLDIAPRTAAAIIGLLFWLHRESQTNDFMRARFSRNFPAGLVLLSNLAYLVVSIALVAQALSLWFVTAADFRISAFPPSSYHH